MHYVIRLSKEDSAISETLAALLKHCHVDFRVFEDCETTQVSSQDPLGLMIEQAIAVMLKRGAF